MAEQSSTLRRELIELLLVAAGAVPGALLRWQVGLHLGDQNVVVNVLGAALLGFLAGLPAAPRRQQELLAGRRPRGCSSRLAACLLVATSSAQLWRRTSSNAGKGSARTSARRRALRPSPAL